MGNVCSRKDAVFPIGGEEKDAWLPKWDSIHTSLRDLFKQDSLDKNSEFLEVREDIGGGGTVTADLCFSTEKPIAANTESIASLGKATNDAGLEPCPLPTPVAVPDPNPAPAPVPVAPAFSPDIVSRRKNPPPLQTHLINDSSALRDRRLSDAPTPKHSKTTTPKHGVSPRNFFRNKYRKQNPPPLEGQLTDPTASDRTSAATTPKYSLTITPKHGGTTPKRLVRIMSHKLDNLQKLKIDAPKSTRMLLDECLIDVDDVEEEDDDEYTPPSATVTPKNGDAPPSLTLTPKNDKHRHHHHHHHHHKSKHKNKHK